MHKLRPLGAAILLFFASLACSRAGRVEQKPSAESSNSYEAELVSMEVTFDGLARDYLLRLPAGYPEAEPYPLVLALHGGGGSAGQMCSLQAGIQTLADQEGFIVACPQGIEEHWNDGRQLHQYRAHQEDIDDVGFISALIENLVDRYAIDGARVFITGYSNGGMMAFRMGCQAAELVRAIAAGIANLPEDLDCQPSRVLPVLILNGTEDPLMPWLGGQVGTVRNPLGQVLSTEATARFWASANGCESGTVVEELPVMDEGDSTRIERMTFVGCQPNSTVLVYSVIGGGHTWPGGSQYAPRFIIGGVSQQANAAELIWAFFESSR